MLRFARLPPVLAALLVGAAASADPADKVVVVVHWTNPITFLKPEAVAGIFLKKATRWPDGREVLPVDQSARSPVREAFTRGVLGDTLMGVEAYWQRQIAAGRVPPVTKSSDAEVLAYVEQHPTAIGYVSGETKLKSTVKAVRLAK